MRLKREPAKRHRMRFDGNHLAGGADMVSENHRVGADIRADIDEHAAGRRMRPQEIQLFDIVVGIEQRAAFGGAGQMMETECRALIMRIDRSAADQVDQAREPGPKHAALDTGAMRERDDGSLRRRRRKCAERRR